MNLSLIRINTFANYLGTGFLVIISAATVPYFLNTLGADAYGLIGFFAILQNILSFFDLGFSQLLGRHAAIAKSRKIEFSFFADILKSFEVYAFFLLIVVLIFASPISLFFSNYWFQSETLANDVIKSSIEIMFICGALQMYVRLYKFSLIGFEDQVWVNMFSIFISSLKFAGALVFIWTVSANIVHFFVYQLVVILIEVIGLRLKLYKNLPANLDLRLRFSIPAIKKVLSLSVSLATVSLLWILATQTDKFVLSKVLPLREFGYFSLIALIASSSIYIVLPIRQAVQPRLTALLDDSKLKEALLLYRQSSHFIALLTGALVTFLFFYSTELIYIWTGNEELSDFSEDILYLFALGTGLFAIQLILVALQIANGVLSLHLKTTVISLVLQIPIITWAAIEHGVLGVAISWFYLRLLFFLLWPFIIHRSFSKDLHFNWLFKDIFPVVSLQFFVGFLISQLISREDILSSYLPVVTLFFIALTILTLGLIYSPYLRKILRLKLSGLDK